MINKEQGDNRYIFGKPLLGNGETYLNSCEKHKFELSNENFYIDNVLQEDYVHPNALGRNLFNPINLIESFGNIVSYEVKYRGKKYKFPIIYSEGISLVAMVQIGNTQPRWRLIEKIKKMNRRK